MSNEKKSNVKLYGCKVKCLSGCFVVGHAALSINGVDVIGKNTADGKDIIEYLKDPANYPVSIRFGRARLSSNEKLMLASMFHS